MDQSSHYFSLLSFKSAKMKNRVDAFSKGTEHSMMSASFFDDIICYYDDPDRMSAEAFSKYDIQTLVHYLEVCHEDYLINQIPAILRNLNEVIRLAPAGHPFEKQGPYLFSEFVEELKRHFTFEEEKLFPYAIGLSKNTSSAINYSTEQYQIDHPIHVINAERLLRFLQMHAEDFNANIAFRILQKRLSDLKADMDLHELLEDSILIPKLQHLELKSK